MGSGTKCKLPVGASVIFAVLGGLAGLLRVLRKLGNSTLRRSTLNAASYYWHFMGVLWVYLFLLLWLKI